MRQARATAAADGKRVAEHREVVASLWRVATEGQCVLGAERAAELRAEHSSRVTELARAHRPRRACAKALKASAPPTAMTRRS